MQKFKTEKVVLKNIGVGLRIVYDFRGRMIKIATGQTATVELKERMANQLRAAASAGNTQLMVFNEGDDTSSAAVKTVIPRVRITKLGATGAGPEKPVPTSKDKPDAALKTALGKEAEKKKTEKKVEPTKPLTKHATPIPPKPAKVIDPNKPKGSDKPKSTAIEVLAKAETLGYHDLLREANAVLPANTLSPRPTDNEIINALRTQVAADEGVAKKQTSGTEESQPDKGDGDDDAE